MNTPNQRDAAPFVPHFSNPVKGTEPQAWLTFPDMETAVEFINTAGKEHYAQYGGSVPVERVEKVHEAPTGEHGQYDAFVRKDHETGEINLMVRHYGHRYPEAHAALSDLVMRTIGEMTEDTPEAH